MCCCGKPIINGENGYSWDGKTFGVYKPSFPELEDGDILIRDLPGRCGGIDSHSHDFRLVKRSITGLDLLVHHGGGSDRVRLHAYGSEAFLESLNDNDLYWLVRMLYSVQRDAAHEAQEAESHKWKQAAAERRIKTRKQRGTPYTKVWMEVA